MTKNYKTKRQNNKCYKHQRKNVQKIKWIPKIRMSLMMKMIKMKRIKMGSVIMKNFKKSCKIVVYVKKYRQ